MEPDEPEKKAQKRPKMVAEERSKRFQALPNEEKGANLTEAPPWLLSGLYLACHSCLIARWTTNDGSMTGRFQAFRDFHKTHDIEFMGAVRFLSEFLKKPSTKISSQEGKYLDIDRPKLKPLIVTFGGMAPHTIGPFEKPNGPRGALEVQRIMRRQHTKSGT